ncbi:MAG: bifunctional alpha,alpha-trehalose-phosphate synthase (UDP-forming)/trehalose-phosphatase, partial [Gemmatimonadales bacterium]
MPRLLIVSNRLPVTVAVGPEGVRTERSVGGLATGLSAPHSTSDGLWIGWPGLPSDELDPAARAQLDRELRAERLEPVHLTADQLARYYTGFSNGIVWPVFHYLTDRAPPGIADWDEYLAVNQRFADRLVELYQPGDRIWVHDYHLFPLPALLRERLPDATIGFFLHIPFPAPEIFRTLPRRREVLRGMLGADLIGMHAIGYLRHFSGAVHHLLGLQTDVDQIVIGERAVQLRVIPMGIDGQRFSALAAEPAVEAASAEFRGESGVRMMLGIDRLDYSKGLPRRLLAFEHLLRTQPELSGKVRMVMLVVPSREDVGAYQEFRDTINALIGRINGAFGTPTWTPVHYMYRALPEAEVVSLYRAADVMLVTPIRDGMNLVAKEYVAARIDGDGVLVLSEFAGAADELVEAILVNPYEIEEMAEAFHQALAMPADERGRRMGLLRERVLGHTVHDWVSVFLAALEDAAATRGGRTEHRSARTDLSSAIEALAEARSRLLLLDYDGTLVPFNVEPERAVPDAELLELLRELTRLPETEVHVVSGRPRRFLQRWLGALPLGLHAEHGAWSRPPAASEWTTAL